MAETRAQIIETMAALLEAQGYHATGLNQIIKESGSPKGSLYYYFPDGKDGLAAAAIEQATDHIVMSIRSHLPVTAEPAVAIRAFIMQVAEQVEASGFRAGGPLTIVAQETAISNDRLNQICQAAYARLIGAFAEKLERYGFTTERAGELATFIIAAMEGGIILSRTQHSGDPLRRVAREVALLLKIGNQRE